MKFEWDRATAARNARNHGATFEDAVTVFTDPVELYVYDPDHSVAEERFVSVGLAASGRLLVVGYTERGSTIRVTFARRATMPESLDYEVA